MVKTDAISNSVTQSVLRQVLLIRSSQPENVFGPFTSELLRSEGLSGFETVDIDSAGLPEFGEGDLIILTRCFLRYAECDSLKAAVEAGARLVCFSPPPSLLARFGWCSLMRVTYPGWIRIEKGYPCGGESIQTHVPVDSNAPEDDASRFVTVAESINPDFTDTGSPAVVKQSMGKGEVAMFFYDMPKAVARIRFGNPDLASHLTSNLTSWPHTTELFTHHLDDRATHLPQADIHCQLLAKVLTDISAWPLPRFWYYPSAKHCSAAIFQGDGDESTLQEFTTQSDFVLACGGTATYFLRTSTKLTEKDVEKFRAKGHTFGPHPWGIDRVEEPYFRVPETLGPETNAFKKRFGDYSRTIQNHYAPWMGYMDWVEDHIRNGFRMLFAYITRWPNQLMCGSGRPIRFFDNDGKLYDCWQQPICIYDDIRLQKIIEEDIEPLLSDLRSLINEATERSHTSIGVLSHPRSFVGYSRPYIGACLELLAERSIPIFNGDEWCDFQYRRDATRIAVSQGDSKITCIVSNLEGELPLMIPIDGHDTQLSVIIDGQAIEANVVHRLEENYLIIALTGKADKSDIQIEFRK